MSAIELVRTPERKAVRMTRPAVSAVLRPRALLVSVGLAVLTAALFAAGLSTGDFDLPFWDVVAALLGYGDEGTMFVIYELRLPRALVGLLVGIAFGLSGALFQTLTRNPLASPDMIGLTSGATTFVVAGVVLGFGAGIGTHALGLFGGLATALVIYLLAWQRGTTRYRIVLVGIGISWMCTSVTSFLLVKAHLWEAQLVMRWLIGSLNGSDWSHLTPLALSLAVLVPATLLLSRWLRLIQMGDDLAIGLGVPVGWAQLALVVVAVGLVSFAAAATGPIVFVALAAPQIAQRLAGLPWPPLVGSALAGSAMVLASDLIAQNIVPGTLLPIGVVTGVLGGVMLLWMLVRANRLGSGG